ncbi:MAG: arginine--tRNA ligase [Lactobacillaceae bacterium]|jgi:arginyl-tRNA synthetase|nr:arginine--tRNA ligase [Lactobacillaceae bacterium]
MELSIEKIINNKFKNIFDKLGINSQFAAVKISDRPDLSDFQCNGALALSKELKKNPREIASSIAAELEKDNDIEKVSVDGPGFINISLKNEFITSVIDKISQDERFGIEKKASKTVVLDFGGPNVAKAMHVGHLRSGVIGEAVQRIETFAGNKVVSDVHFGDWGTPIGMIIAEIINEKCDAFSLNVEEITELYKKANIRCKEDEKAKETARIITAKMQDGDPEYRKIWKYIRDVSIEDVKKNYENLDVNFNLWWGESDAHDASSEIVKIAKEKGISEIDGGANIIRLDEGNKPKPPVILEKSDGGFTYHTTDIATILLRVRDLKADEIIYFTDKRQEFHFEQVFEAAEKLGIAPGVKLKHIGFGTVNGSDGKPFKTRDGGVMTLESLIELSKEKVRESMPKANAEYNQEYIDNLIDEIAIGAIKFQDLKNNIASGYIFEVDDFAKFEGKTGPYIQYAVARINSILRKAKDADIDFGGVIITNNEERELALKILQLNNVVNRADEEFEPSIISDYAYTLAQTFSSFYSTSPILNENNEKVMSSRLRLAKLVRDILVLLLYLLGIKSPEVMLKA